MAESVVDLGWLWSIGHALNDFQGMITRQLSSAMSKISVSRSIPPGIAAYLFISGMAIPRVLSLILRWLVEVPSCRHMAELIESTVDNTEGHRVCGAQNCYR